MTHLAKRDSELPAVVTEKIAQLAKQEGIPVSGLNILGGKTYINVTGLDCKVQNKCADEHLVLKGIDLKELTPEGENLFGFKATIQFFDRENFQKALKACTEVNKDVLDKLESTFTYSFSDIGLASPDTCEGIAYEYVYDQQKGRKVKGKLLKENVIMMASRRATNRAKREATGTGLTSLDEMPMEAAESNGKPHVEPPRAKSAAPAVQMKPEPAADPDAEMRETLRSMMKDLAGEDGNCNDLLEQYSGFEGKDGQIKAVRNLKDLKGKWLQSTYGKVKKDWESAGFNAQPIDSEPIDEDEVPF
jgi:hypothetical protein